MWFAAIYGLRIILAKNPIFEWKFWIAILEKDQSILKKDVSKSQKITINKVKQQSHAIVRNEQQIWCTLNCFNSQKNGCQRLKNEHNYGQLYFRKKFKQKEMVFWK